MGFWESATELASSMNPFSAGFKLAQTALIIGAFIVVLIIILIFMGTREKYMGRRYVAMHPWSQWGMSGVYKGGPSIRYQDWDDPYMNQANPEQKPVVTYALDGIRELTIPDADWSVGAKSGSLQASAIRDNVDAGNAGMSQIDTENFSDGYQGQHGSCWTNPGHIYCKKGNIGNERHQIPENPMPAYINMNRPPGY